jgi:hypothetical protein
MSLGQLERPEDRALKSPWLLQSGYRSPRANRTRMSHRSSSNCMSRSHCLGRIVLPLLNSLHRISCHRLRCREVLH